MTRLKSAAVILIVIIFSVFSACSGNNEEIDIRGNVTSVTPSDSGVTLMVEGEIEEDTKVDKALVFIKNDVPVTDMEGNKLSPSDIKTGDGVEIIFTGPVRDPYPVQADAKSVKIIIKAVQDAVLY